MNKGFVARSAALEPFRVRSFRFQWPADLATSWAIEMEVLILGWYILVETGSVRLLVLYGALQYLGSLIAPLFGVAGDRFGHRNLLCLARTMFAALAAALMTLALIGNLTPVSVFVIATLAGIIRPSDYVLRTALIAQTMPPGQLLGALGISRTSNDSARIAGALVGAGAFAALGMGWAYGVVTFLYATSFLLSLGIAGTPARSNAPRQVASTTWHDLRHAFVYVWRKPDLLGAMCLAFLVNLLAFPFFFGLLPYVAKEIYGAGQIGLGYLVASFSLGALIGSILLGMNRLPLRASRTMIVAAAAWFIAVLAFAQVTNMAAGIVLLTAAGLAQSLCTTPLAAVVLRGSALEFRGRVMGVRTLAILGLPVGLLVSGPLITGIGFAATGTAYALAGLVLTLMMMLRWHAHLWRLAAPANARI